MSEARGFPGQLELEQDLGSVEIAGAPYLVYPVARLEHAPGTPTVCLVSRDHSSALRATLRRLSDPSLPRHRVLIVDGGSDDWSLSDAIAHAAAHDNAVVFEGSRAATMGTLYAAALEAAGDGTSVLVPVHPELAAAALQAFVSALGRATDAHAAVPGDDLRLLRGDVAAAALRDGAGAGPAPLLALRGPVAVPSALGRARTPAGVAVALSAVLRRGHCVVAPFPPTVGWPADPVAPADIADVLEALGPPGAGSPGETLVDTTVFWPGAEPLRLGQHGAFTFLLVTPWDGDARWELVLSAYARAFGAGDPVSLAIVVLGPDQPSDETITADVLAVLETARPGAGDDLADIALHTRPDTVEHLPAIYAGADCLIATGTTDRSRRSAFEGMASGLPVIAPLDSGLEGALTDAWGHPLAELSVAALEQALAAVVADPTAAAARGAEARRRALRVSTAE